MRDLIFALLLGSDEAETDALRLARSIRTFGGHYCFNPIWMVSLRDEQDLSEATRQDLYSIGVRLVSFELEPQNTIFPFESYITAAGIAEGLAQGEASYLVWMAADTLILQEPAVFRLQPGKSFGGCPVHLKLLGSGSDEPVNDFWDLIYRQCHVDIQNIFSMQTVVDEQSVRAYFNAGLLVVRPERGLLRGWQSAFNRSYQMPELDAFYRQSETYKIFVHQAILAGSLLSALRQEEVQQFPMEVNYPLHLHSKISEKRRPASPSQLITCRYEEYADTLADPNVQAFLQMDKPLYNWLHGQFA